MSYHELSCVIMSYHEFSITGFLGLFPPFVVFHPPAAMDRRTIENPFLTRDVFLVRCPSPHGPSVLPLLRLMRLGAWRSLSVFCAFFLMRLPCSLSFSFSCLHRCSSGFHGCVPRRQLSLPPPHLCPTDRRLQRRRLESCQLPHKRVWLVALPPFSRVSHQGGGAQPPWQAAWS